MNSTSYKITAALQKPQNEIVSDTAFAILPEYFFYLLSDQEKERRLDAFKSAFQGEGSSSLGFHGFQILAGKPSFEKAV